MVLGRYPHKWADGGVSAPSRIRERWRSGGPSITIALTIVCVMVWLAEVCTRYLAPSAYALLLNSTAFSPSVMAARPWTLVTSLFVHSINISHIACNMVALWVVGSVMERALGHWRFLALYLLCGLGGDLGLIAWGWMLSPEWYSYAIGASGAIFGLFGALLVAYRRLGVDIRGMVVLMAVNFLLPLFLPNIAWQAHLGGFIVGAAAMGAMWPWLSRRLQSPRLDANL